jgi:putative FmdB family regulatory protein
MPIYEYRCTACGHELEALQKLSDAPLVACPACGKEALRKMVTAAGFQLKGSGWYQTDFRSSGAKPPAKPGAGTEGAGKPVEGSAAKSEAPADTKTDSKAETKAATTPESKASPASGTAG